MSEAFMVVVVIHKLPEMWKEFKSYLIFKNKEMTWKALFFKLNVEEENRMRTKVSRPPTWPRLTRWSTMSLQK